MPSAVLQALVPLVQRKQDRSFLEQAQKNMREWRELLEKRGTSTDTPMKPQVAAYNLNKVLADDAIIACDCGTVTTWAAPLPVDIAVACSSRSRACWRRWPRACPTRSAAAVAYPRRQVVAIVGDGGFTMLMGEMATMCKYNLPVKVMIIKNNALGPDQVGADGDGGQSRVRRRAPADRLRHVRRGLRRAGFTMDDPTQGRGMVRRAFAQPGPALIEAVVDPNEPPMPGQITTEQAIKFAESLVRGEQDRFTNIKDVLADKVRETV